METRIPLEILDNSDAVTRQNIQSVIDDFTGATSGTNGVRGFVPAPPQGSQNNFLRGDGTWSNAAVVNQSVSSSNGNYPILLVPVSDASTSQSNQTVIFAPGVSVNPSTGNITATSFTGDFTGDISGNAETATSLASNFTIALSGDVSGSTTTNGTGTATITTSVADDSHNHIISNVDGLQDALDGKAALTHTHSANDIITGTFDASVIPSLDASKITSGVFNAARIPNLDASKLTSGTIDISRLPAGALERLIVVADETARFALTTSDVQNGDTVKQNDTGELYYVKDDSNLNSAAGYEEYVAGTAAHVPWTGITGRPSTFPPTSHNHGNISNTGTLTGTSKVVITNQSGQITTSTNTTPTELEYVHGVTSAIQTQLDGKAAVNHEHDASEITSGTFSANQIPGLDASKIVSGVLSIDRIPADAKPKMVVVADETARFALTTAQVKNGDLVKQLDNQTVYYVVDETKLNLPAGYEEYTAPAADVSWNDIEDKPSSFTPASHTHGLIQNNGTLNTANMAVVTNGSKQIATSATVTATELGYVHGVTSAIQTQLDGKANTSHGTHVTYSTTNPAANGTASPGSADNVSRGDHVHPLQTTISGNAGTATKFASAQSITLTGDVTGTKSSQAGWSIATTLSTTGVTAGTYNSVTVDAKGRVTAGSNVQYCMHVDTLPSSTPADLVDGGILIVG